MKLISYHRSRSTLGYDWFVYSDYYQMAGWIDHPIINYRLVSKEYNRELEYRTIFPPYWVIDRTINLLTAKEVRAAGDYEK